VSLCPCACACVCVCVRINARLYHDPKHVICPIKSIATDAESRAYGSYASSEVNGPETACVNVALLQTSSRQSRRSGTAARTSHHHLDLRQRAGGGCKARGTATSGERKGVNQNHASLRREIPPSVGQTVSVTGDKSVDSTGTILCSRVIESDIKWRSSGQ